MTATSSSFTLATQEGRRHFRDFYRSSLLFDTIPFWFPRSIDTQHGGFLHCVDRDGTLLDSDKSVWAQGRMSWMLLTLYNTLEPRQEWLNWGLSGLEFLTKHGFDADGRMFFHVTVDGRPIRKRRYAYSECFASIAFAAAARATGRDHDAARADELFTQFYDWNFTPGRMPPKFTETRPMIGLGPRMMAISTVQELRTNLGSNAGHQALIDRCLDDIERLFVRPDRQVVMENVAPNGDIVDHFDGRQLNPGHAIEAAWFILVEARYRRDAQLLRLGCQMLDWMWERGWDPEFGGLFYFRDVDGRPVQEYWHDMKFWWPHDETIIATLIAYEMTGDERYAQRHRQIHDWSHQHFADPEYGEWFGYLHRDGRRSVTIKGNLWKSFFHHPRMQWMCWKWLEQAIADVGN
ncbi:MAG TPA: AGE family epimerase/isomerase [Caulifigura sp.]|nr:AGE family epimerase/isomerase [Caulifigura sp.]